MKKIKVDIQKLSDVILQWIGSTKSLIVHTLIFIVTIALYFLNIDFKMVMLILTTVVSIEAIYLSIFILMSGNIQMKAIKDIKVDVEDIQEDVKEIQEDVEDIQEGVEDIQEGVEDIQEGDEDEYDKVIDRFEQILKTLIDDINSLKNRKK